MWKKFSVTQKVIFIGIIVLIVVDIILWGNVAKLKSPSARFEDAINAGNIASAVASYNEMQGSSQKSNRFNAEKLANKYARIRLADYLAGITLKVCDEAGPVPCWSKPLWDVTAVAWLLNDHDRFLLSRLITAPIPEYDGRYADNPDGHLMRYVYHINRDILLEDLIGKLTDEAFVQN